MQPCPSARTGGCEGAMASGVPGLRVSVLRSLGEAGCERAALPCCRRRGGRREGGALPVSPLYLKAAGAAGVHKVQGRCGNLPQKRVCRRRGLPAAASRHAKPWRSMVAKAGAAEAREKALSPKIRQCRFETCSKIYFSASAGRRWRRRLSIYSITQNRSR
jgi:hypothetical protein